MSIDNKEFLKERLDYLKSQEKRIQDEISIIRKYLQKIRFKEEEVEMTKLPEGGVKVKYFLFEDGLVDGKRYEEREKFWYDRGFFVAGYDVDTEQVCLEILIERDNDAYAWARQLEDVYPYISPYSDGKVVIGVMDSCFNVLFDKGNYSIVEKTSGRVVKEFDNLEETFDYLIKVSS